MTSDKIFKNLREAKEYRKSKKILLRKRILAFLLEHCEDLTNFVEMAGIIRIPLNEMRDFHINIHPQQKTDARAIARAIRESGLCTHLDFRVENSTFIWTLKN